MTSMQGAFAYLGIALTILFLFAVFYYKRPDLFFDLGDRRRSGDLKYFKNQNQPGSFIKYNIEDGRPCDRRGRVWDELERDLFMQRDRNRRLRIRQ